MLRDLRYAVRALSRHRAAYAVMTAVLGLALGSATALFSLIDAALLHPLPYADPGKLVELRERLPEPGAYDRLPAGDFAELARESRSFEGLAAILSTGMPITSLAEPMNPLMRRASAGYFRLLGVEPILGRAFLPEEDVPGGPRVTVLSHELWQSQLGGDPAAVGRTIGLDGEPYTIVGVLPPGFRDPRFVGRPALWLPLALSADELATDVRQPRRLTAVFGRLAAGVSLEAARAEVERLGKEIAARRGAAAAAAPVLTVDSLREIVVAGYRPALVVLFLAVLLVVALACGNFAHLLLARAFDRRREIALRTALGADRRHVARLLLAEGLLLALAGLAIGLVIAAVGIDLLVKLLPERLGVPRLDAVGFDPRAVGFAAALALLCAAGFGLAPLGRTLREAASGLAGGPAAGGPAGGSSRRRLLIVGEVAVSSALLVSAGAMVLTLSRLTGAPPGFEPAGVLTLRTSARGNEYGSRERWGDFYDRLGGRLGALPEVEAVGGVDRLPLDRPWQGTAFAVPGRDTVAGAEPRAMVFTVTPGYFDALRIPVLRGRAFAAADRGEAAAVAILSREAARLYFAGAGAEAADGAVGGEVTVAGEDAPRRIVGVAGDVRLGDVPPVPRPVIYVPLAQKPQPTLGLAIRTSLRDPSSLGAVVQRTIAEVSRDAPVYDVVPLSQVLRDVDWQPRFLVRLLGGFAALAFALAACGLYAVLSYVVSGQVRELALRKALGARRGHLVGGILGEALGLAVSGLVLAVPLTYGAGRLLGGQLIGVSIWDPRVLAGTAVLMVASSLAASFDPARRVDRADPANLLREP